jgi:hypothetical protein
MKSARIEAAERLSRGSSSLELVICVGLWGCAMAVLASAWQITTTADDVADAAGQAARAAALTSSSAEAVQIAGTTARARLSVGACAPDSVTVLVDARAFRAGGTVQVTVSCRTHLPVAPDRTVQAVSEEAIDQYRGGL